MTLPDPLLPVALPLAMTGMQRLRSFARTVRLAGIGQYRPFESVVLLRHNRALRSKGQYATGNRTIHADGR